MTTHNEPPALHYLYFPTESLGKAAEEDIRRLGMRVELHRGREGVNWLTLVAHEWPISSEAFDVITVDLGKVAEAHSGEYDGWETPDVA